MDEYKRVYIVERMGESDTLLLAAFSDSAEACSYANMQNDRMRAMGGDAVSRVAAVVPLDPPRELW